MEKLKSKLKRPISDAKILIVDDEPINCEIMQHMLGDLYKVSSVCSGEEAIEACLSDKPDLILLDVMMRGISGIETCRLIKDNEETQHIPIIFITSLQEEQQEADCWDAGAVDFVTKPVLRVELRNRVRAHLTHKMQTDLLLSLSYVDKLTGAYNRHFLDDVLPKIEKQSKRKDTPISVMMMDIDWFKLYNDEYGHLKGDQCLREVADNIAEVLTRPVDLLFRFGGEEFMVLLIDTNKEGALHVANEVLETLRLKGIPHPKSLFSYVSLSIGVATFLPSVNNGMLADTIQQADKQLYKAKSTGRNQVKV
ncbi:MAG: diguanylate cyclase [Paraglaciecola sp.]|uniref:diguanylate cyclase n=1 Tax=Paraglaciecola sp. TaxID=1920173 RepID=UPI00273F4FEB|nr:diguanylate cyclase [Paraglaciecola sp.]MDP5031937.1 diguanylate cyclase [Paraglaciecola sp.]MDP5131207.1 diguanylate cyclase [Paraglaciecola sp.]